MFTPPQTFVFTPQFQISRNNPDIVINNTDMVVGWVLPPFGKWKHKTIIFNY